MRSLFYVACAGIRHLDHPPERSAVSADPVVGQAGDEVTDELASLRTDLWTARDAAIGAEAAAGQLRGRVKALESELDDRQRHVAALLAEVEMLRRALAEVEGHRDAMLRSPTWRIGKVVMKPVQAVRRRPTT
jgi:hypothetical protein